jgi:hypothetical protein
MRDYEDSVTKPTIKSAAAVFRRLSTFLLLTVLAVLSCAFSVLFVSAPVNHLDSVPFPVGEKLSYRVSWSNVIEAGTAELSVAPSTKVAAALKLELKAATTTTLAKGYDFRDEFVSHFDPTIGAPRLFAKNFTEKKRIVKETTSFSQINRTANFVNSKNQSKTFAVETGTQDPVSALYALRMIGLSTGVRIEFPVVDGGLVYLLSAKVVGRELITTKLGAFDTHRVEVSVRGETTSRERHGITLWITTDARRIPVLASVAFPIGAGVIELVNQVP